MKLLQWVKEYSTENENWISWDLDHGGNKMTQWLGTDALCDRKFVGSNLPEPPSKWGSYFEQVCQNLVILFLFWVLLYDFSACFHHLHNRNASTVVLRSDNSACLYHLHNRNASAVATFSKIRLQIYRGSKWLCMYIWVITSILKWGTEMGWSEEFARESLNHLPLWQQVVSIYSPVYHFRSLNVHELNQIPTKLNLNPLGMQEVTLFPSVMCSYAGVTLKNVQVAWDQTELCCISLRDLSTYNRTA